MKRYRSLLFYVITLLVFSGIIFYIIRTGEKLEPAKVDNFTPQITASTWQQFKETYLQNLTHPLAILLLQIITIIIAARIFGYLCRKIRQPSVVGEIIAGIFLGPSFIGHFFPEFSAFLFPPSSLGNLQFLSQIGLILFMFIVGMELDLNVLKNKAKDAVVVSHASIIFPFALGITLSYFLYLNFAPPDIKFLSFSLFIGIAMSITAFPVLARIVQERGLSKTRIGAIVITCAAADDITAWCILAVVIAIVKAGSIISAFYTILMAVAYVFIMLRVVKPFLKRLGDKYANKEALSKPVVAIFFITLLLSSYATEVISIHALFGAFMAGVIMPANVRFRNIFIEKVDDVSTVLLLPLFFVFTGLRTQIGLLDEPYLWKICAIIIAVAVIGKFLGSAIAARFTGQKWRDSLVIGALMNTRGLMELIVLNIGYDLGVLTPEIFAMMVIMALATTFMTGPAMDLIERFMPESAPAPVKTITGQFKVLVSFGTPEKGVALLRLAHHLIGKSIDRSTVTALHLSPGSELNQFNQEEFERLNFAPIESAAQELRMPVISMFKPTDDIETAITETANAGNFDLLLVGAGTSVYEGTLLGKLLGITTKIINPERLYDTITGKEKLFETSVFDDRIKQITRAARMPVGIFIDKNLTSVRRVFVPVYSIGDTFLLIYARKLISNSNSRITIMDAGGFMDQQPEMKDSIQSIDDAHPAHVDLYSNPFIEKELLEQHDLVLISFESWKKAVDDQSTWLSETNSVLILKP